MTKKKTPGGSRSFPSWIEGFVDATSQASSPEMFRRWGAISCLAGVLERRVWVFTQGKPLYPNLFVLLIARPGGGKTEITDRVRLLWEGIEDLHVSSSNLSRASLADELNDARVITPSNEYNALTSSINELGTLVSKYSRDFMSQLTDLYDCLAYTERKRGGRLTIKLDAPYMNMIAASTPAHLNSVLPEGAWDEGFMSRCILIFSGEKLIKDLFDVPAIELEGLAKDLLKIRKMRGKFDWSDEAKDFINRWHKSGGQPKPQHPKLTYYCERRTAHLLKLTQIAKADVGDDMVIELEHIQTALDWLMQAEGEMENIFKAMTAGGDSSIISDAFHWLMQVYIREKRPVARTRFYAYLSERTDAYKVRHILEVMEQSGRIQVETIKGRTAYKPTPKGARQ